MTASNIIKSIRNKYGYTQDDMAKMRKLLDNLEDNDDVQSVWHNWENEDDYEG